MAKRFPKFNWDRAAREALAATAGDATKALAVLVEAHVEHETARAIARRPSTDPAATRDFFRYWAGSASGMYVARGALREAGADWVRLAPAVTS